MNKNLDDYINRLRLEDTVWYIYGALIVLNLISNEYEKRHVIKNDIQDRNIFRKINIFVFIVALFIYVFFLIRNIKENNFNNNIKKQKLNSLSLFSSVIFMIGGIINLFIEIEGYDQELEI